MVRGEAPPGGKNVNDDETLFSASAMFHEARYDVIKRFEDMHISSVEQSPAPAQCLKVQENMIGLEGVPHVPEVEMQSPQCWLVTKEVSQVGIISSVPLEVRINNDTSGIGDVCAVTGSNPESEATMSRSCETKVVTSSDQTVLFDEMGIKSGDISLGSDAHIQTVVDDLTRQYNCKQEDDLSLSLSPHAP